MKKQRTWISDLSWISVEKFDALFLKIAVPGVHVVDQDGGQDSIVILRPAKALVASDDADERPPGNPVDLGPVQVLDRLEAHCLFVEMGGGPVVVEEGDL